MTRADNTNIINLIDMPTYKSNMKQILEKLKNRMDPAKMDKMYLEISENLLVSNINRIHNRGRAVDEQGIGKYSTNYAKWRQKHGRQAGYVDLEVNGTLRSDLKIMKKGLSWYTIGFSRSLSGKIRTWMEAHFMKKIWGVTSADRNRVRQVVKRYFK